MQKLSFYIPVFILAVSLQSQAEVARIRVSPDQVHWMSHQIAKQIAPQFSPDLLVGIARGGLSLLHYLSAEEGLDQRLLTVVSLRSYDATQQGELSLVSSSDFRSFANCLKVLIVDDLADSGKSLLAVKKLVQDALPQAEVKTATFFYKKRSVIEPDFYYDTVESWMVFPSEYKAKAALNEYESWYKLLED